MVNGVIRRGRGRGKGNAVEQRKEAGCKNGMSEVGLDGGQRKFREEGRREWALLTDGVKCYGKNVWAAKTNQPRASLIHQNHGALHDEL